MTTEKVKEGTETFNVFCFKANECDIMIASKEGNDKFRELVLGLMKKYNLRGGHYTPLSVDAVEFTKDKADAIFAEFPQMKRQLEFNEKNNYDFSHVNSIGDMDIELK